MKNNFIKAIVLVLFCWTAMEANAQWNPKWTIGVKGGLNWTNISRSNMGRIDETYSALICPDAGLQARYQLNDWLAIRADLDIMSRWHRMDRNLHYLEPVFTCYNNDYLMLPLMDDFSFGGRQLRGHAYCGGFGGYWIKAWAKGTTYWMTDYYVYFNDFDEIREFNSEDQRLIAGAVGGLGLSYSFFDSSVSGGGPVVSLDVMYYHDLVSHHKGYAHLSDPRYLNTLSITLGIAANF